jgi:hypothetical protein
MKGHQLEVGVQWQTMGTIDEGMTVAETSSAKVLHWGAMPQKAVLLVYLISTHLKAAVKRRSELQGRLQMTFDVVRDRAVFCFAFLSTPRGINRRHTLSFTLTSNVVMIYHQNLLPIHCNEEEFPLQGKLGYGVMSLELPSCMVILS